MARNKEDSPRVEIGDTWKSKSTESVAGKIKKIQEEEETFNRNGRREQIKGVLLTIVDDSGDTERVFFPRVLSPIEAGAFSNKKVTWYYEIEETIYPRHGAPWTGYKLYKLESQGVEPLVVVVENGKRPILENAIII